MLLRDLTATANDYAQERLSSYALQGGWDTLPARNPPARPLRVDDTMRLQAGLPLLRGELTTLDLTVPASSQDWVVLGREVFFRYPLRADGAFEAAAALPTALLDSGVLLADDDGEPADADDAAATWVGLAVFEDDDSRLRIGPTCAQCHGSFEPTGRIDGRIANRRFDIGGLLLRARELDPAALPGELESSAEGDLARLGPGRADVMPDGVFNPFAVPDFGGLGDHPLLHHNANWRQMGTVTLAVRCETLFITGNAAQTRIPRVLSWAFAAWLRSLPPAPPSREPDASTERGAAVFEAAACDGCHVPPLYASDREVDVEAIGTDPAAGDSRSRRTGHYRVPSLRGVTRAAPYLHDGSVPSLEIFFDANREAPGHPYGQDLSLAEKADLIAFLGTI